MNHFDFASVDIPLTLREKIVQALKAKLLAMQHEDGQGMWKNVLRGDPDDQNFQADMGPFVCVEDGDEVVTSQWMHDANKKGLVIYFHVRFPRGIGGAVDAATVFNYYLGKLQATIFSDYRLGGLCHDIQETSNAPQIFTQDNLQGGYLAINAEYRHQPMNPYQHR